MSGPSGMLPAVCQPTTHLSQRSLLWHDRSFCTPVAAVLTLGAHVIAHPFLPIDAYHCDQCAAHAFSTLSCLLAPTGAHHAGPPRHGQADAHGAGGHGQQ